VKINGETHYLWRAVNHEGEVLESYVTKRRDRKAALKFFRKSPIDSKQAAGAVIRQRIHICRFDDESGRCSVSGRCDV